MPSIDVSVVVPVFNNAATLDELLDRLAAVLESVGVSFEIVAVDDGSRDGSFAILERRAAADPRIRPFAMVRNFGSQAASCAGFDLARGRRVVHIDADLELYPEDIPPLLEAMDRGADLVCAYRENRQDPWLTRRLPSTVMNAYVRGRTGANVRDIGCGLRAAESWIVKDLAAEGENRRYLTPLFLRRARHVVEVGVRHRRKAVRTGHSFLTLLGVVLDYYMITAKRPFLITGLISLSTLLVGIAVLLLGRPLLGVVIAGFGGMGALTSLLGEYAQRIYQLGQDLPFYQLRKSAAEPGPEAREVRRERAG